MKIIQLIYSLSSGGAERFVVDLSNRLADMGHEVHLCMLRDGREPGAMFNARFLDTRVKLHCLGLDRGFSVAKCMRVERFIKSVDPDVVHCHLNVVPYIFRLALFSKRIRFVHTLHNVAEKCVGLKAQYRINRYFYSRDIIRPVTISRRCQISYADFYGLDNAPVIDNGCSDVVESASFELVRSEVSSYKKGPNTPVFVHVARFHPQKNQQLLIDAFNALNGENIDFTLLIIGAHYDESEGIELQRTACGKIHFLGEKSNVGDYLLCSNAFCLTSRYEGLPISLLEALSCGLTPVCTTVGGIPDVIEEGTTGYLSEDLTVDGYVSAVKNYLKTPIDPKILKNLFAQKYSMKTCAEKYVEQYESRERNIR
jgi:glycosyltransferase involved in cell wall biosynthesis